MVNIEYMVKIMKNDNKQPVTNHQSPITIFLKGFCMGAADVVPGVSGGTMALILNIYTRLINAIKSFDLAWVAGCLRLDMRAITGRPDWPFIIPLLIGIAGALFFFTRVVPLPMLLETHPEAVYGLFFGLILGSILVLVPHTGRLNLRNILVLAAGTALGLFFFNLVPMETPEAGWFIFLSGALAISAMILPGISGSFVLLMLKKYSYIFNAIGHLDFSVLIPFALGIVTGLALFSRFLSWLLARYRQLTLQVINGLLIGSLWVIWPFQHREFEIIHGKQLLVHTSPAFPDHFNGDVMLSVALMITGLVVVLVINRLANNVNATQA